MECDQYETSGPRLLNRRYYRLALTLILLGLTSFGFGQEGNYKFENFGNQSVLLNGNVTGSVADLGLTYYNPARLGLIENPSFTIGGKAYELSRYGFEDVLDTDKNLNSNQFVGIPATLAGTFSLKFLPDHKFAYSIITRQQSNIQIRYESGLVPVEPSAPGVENDKSLTDLYFQDRLKDDWLGVSWAYPISESFSVGASLFASAYVKTGRGDILVITQPENNMIRTYSNRLDFRQRTYGAEIRVGAAWKHDDIDMGVNLSIPFIPVYQSASLGYQESLGGISSDADFVTDLKYDDLENTRKTAWGIAYGVGLAWKRHTLHLNIDWHSRVREYERIKVPDGVIFPVGDNPFEEELKAILNFGAGGEFYLSPSINIITSFSTDFSATKESINLFDYVNQSSDEINLLDDIWHLAAGMDLHRPWGRITAGFNYARSLNKIDSDAGDIPLQPPVITSGISYQRWRFIIGFEIPLINDKLKGLPIPIN
jgi:hypothetical protein